MLMMIVRRRNQSHPLARHVDAVDNDGHGGQEQTEIYCSRKTSYTKLLFIFHTRTVTTIPNTQYGGLCHVTMIMMNASMLSALTSCQCACACVYAWACAGMHVRVRVRRTGPT
jgi:hypothetical protein